MGRIFTQFVNTLLTGLSGGQTISGGIDAKDNLTLQSTTNATKGAILLGTGGLVGINKSTALAQLSVQPKANFTGTGTVSTTATSAAVTGVGTLFTTEVAVGDRITINGETRMVKGITSDTALTLATNMTGTNTTVAFTDLKAVASFWDVSSNNMRLFLDDNGRLRVLGSGSFPDFATTTYTGPIFSTNAADTLHLSNNAGGTVAILFSGSSTVGSGLSQIASIRDNTVFSGNTNLSFYNGNQNGTPSVTILNQNGSNTVKAAVGIGLLAKMATLSVQSPADITGVGTVSNGAGGTTLTGVSTVFTLQCAVGDRVTVNGNTVQITAIASNTSLTYSPSIAGANSGVAFTIKKAIFTGIDSGGTTRLTLMDSGDLQINDANNIIVGTTTGTQVATATTQLLAFHGSTPVVQRAGSAQAAVVGTGSALASYGYTQAQADSIVTLVNELRAALVEKGIIKGSA